MHWSSLLVTKANIMNLCFSHWGETVYPSSIFQVEKIELTERLICFDEESLEPSLIAWGILQRSDPQSTSEGSSALDSFGHSVLYLPLLGKSDLKTLSNGQALLPFMSMVKLPLPSVGAELGQDSAVWKIPPQMCVQTGVSGADTQLV